MADMIGKKTINADLENVYGENNIFFTGIEDQTNLYLDPYVSGYAFIYWVSVPSWFEKDPDLKYFKQMTQKNFRSFSGVGSINLNTAQHQIGFAGHEGNVVSGIDRNNTEFTLSHKEYSGGIMRKLYQKWVSYIRDPRTGIALYPKLFGEEYGARNHSAQLLYIVTRPDVTNTDKNIVEYACFYSNVIPTNVPLDSLYNFDLGTQDSPTIEITFKGFPEIGPDVEEYAGRILKDKIMSKTGDGYLPFVDSYNTNTEASSSVQWGSEGMSLKEIYNYENK